MKIFSFRIWLETLALKGSYRGSVFQRLVAGSYQIAPTSDPAAHAAFEDLKRKITRQQQFLSSKFAFRPTQDDPYPSMKAMTKDIMAQRAAGVKKPVVPVYAEPPQMDGQASGGHPYLSNDDNVTQRGVHDIIAHYFGQHPFSSRGEFGAYNRHLKTLCNTEQVKAGKCLAAQAMFTEVVAQTSYHYIYGTFADQKAVLLLDFDHARVGLLSPSSPLNRYFAFDPASKSMEVRPEADLKGLEQERPELAAELRRQWPGRGLAPIFPEENGSQPNRQTA